MANDSEVLSELPAIGFGAASPMEAGGAGASDPRLGFCRFRIPQAGRRVIWEVTNACNYGCSYCMFASTARRPPGELEQVAGARCHWPASAGCGFTHVKFTGGEPFLRPDMAELLERAVALGLRCNVSTNASRIGGALAARLARLAPRP